MMWVIVDHVGRGRERGSAGANDVSQLQFHRNNVCVRSCVLIAPLAFTFLSKSANHS